jgi:hypothetical protein
MRACRFSRTPSRSCERGCHDPDGSCRDSREPAVLSGLAAYTGPAMVLYGEYDIFGTSADVVRRRLPHAVQVSLRFRSPALAAEPGPATAMFCAASTLRTGSPLPDPDRNVARSASYPRIRGGTRVGRVLPAGDGVPAALGPRMSGLALPGGSCGRGTHRRVGAAAERGRWSGCLRAGAPPLGPGGRRRRSRGPFHPGRPRHCDDRLRCAAAPSGSAAGAARRRAGLRERRDSAGGARLAGRPRAGQRTGNVAGGRHVCHSCCPRGGLPHARPGTAGPRGVRRQRPRPYEGRRWGAQSRRDRPLTGDAPDVADW